MDVMVTFRVDVPAASVDCPFWTFGDCGAYVDCSTVWSANVPYQHPSEFVASHGPPGVSPARTTFLWWLYCVDTAFEFASINVSRVWAEVAARGVDGETGEDATRNDVAAVPDASVDEPPRVATPPRALASDEPRELPIST